MSDDLDIIPIPQLNPANGRMEKGFKIKSSKSGGMDGMDGSVICILIALALIIAIGFALWWTTRKLITLIKRVQAHRQAQAEAKRLAAPPAAARGVDPRYADAATRERREAEAIYDRMRGVR